MIEKTETGPASGMILRFLGLAPVRLLLLTGLLFYMYFSGHMFRGSFARGWWQDLVVVLWMIVLTLTLYVRFVNVVEKRPASEVAPVRVVPELGLGLLLGAGTYTACVLILVALGIYRIDGIADPAILLGALWFAVSSGFFEELFFRGVVMRITTEIFGSWAGLLVSAVLFGLVHLNNSGATVQGAVFIAIEAGILLGAAYMLTGRLWLGMGWHMSWNYTQSAVFSGITSGNEPSQGLVRATIAGPEYLTGGSFGMEASVVALALGTLTGLVFLYLAVHRGKVIPPFWMRR